MVDRQGGVVSRRRGDRLAWLRGAVIAACLASFTVSASSIAEAPEVGVPPGLRAPTSPLFGDVAWYDLVALRWSDPGAWPAWLEIELAAVDTGGAGPLGLRQPIVEVYVDDGSGGATALLPGSGLRMPPGDGWRYAARVTGDGAWGWRVDPVTERWSTPEPLAAGVDGRVVRIAWPWPRPEDARVYAISGVHDPFSADGWRAFSPTPSPWAFSAGDPVGPPVVDVLPGDAAAWERVRASGELRRAPTPAPVGDGRSARWWWLMAVGLATAVVGLWWRHRTGGAPPAAEPGPETPPAPPAGPPDLIGEGDLEAADQPAAGTVAAEASAATPTASATGDGSTDDSRATEAPSPESRSANRS